MASALQMGYRFLDTAYNYENEGAVGKAVERSEIARSEIVIQSKLPGRYHSYDAALVALQESLLRANLEYFDLYLIHWPNPLEDKYVEAWKALITAKEMGWVKSIGVSNFLPDYIKRLEDETGVLPVINQIEVHPFLNQLQQASYHQEKGIGIQAWSPLGRGTYLKNDVILQELAVKYEVTPAQLVLRWLNQRGIVSLPRSSNLSRLRQNIQIFDFSIEEADMLMINKLGKPGYEGSINGLNPADHQEF